MRCDRQIELQFLGSRDLSKAAIQSPERQVAGFPGELQHQAIGKSQRWPGPEEKPCPICGARVPRHDSCECSGICVFLL